MSGSGQLKWLLWPTLSPHPPSFTNMTNTISIVQVATCCYQRWAVLWYFLKEPPVSTSWKAKSELDPPPQKKMGLIPGIWEKKSKSIHILNPGILKKKSKLEKKKFWLIPGIWKNPDSKNWLVPGGAWKNQTQRTRLVLGTWKNWAQRTFSSKCFLRPQRAICPFKNLRFFDPFFPPGRSQGWVATDPFQVLTCLLYEVNMNKERP